MATGFMWVILFTLVSVLLYIDLGILNKKAHEVSLKEAGCMVAGWVSIALLFAVFIYFNIGHEFALQYLTAYIIEYSLSMDNMFVFILIFGYFAVPAKYQARVLHWGILGAVVMRLVLIFAGVALVQKFSWILYLFGIILIVTSVKMMAHDNDKVDPEQNFMLKLFKKFMPFTSKHHEERFFVRENSKLVATPLFAALLVIEASDLVFAVDSIPAVIAITQDRFIAYSSNIFAVLGLRALYFLLAGMIKYFVYLKYGISIILMFIGVKMLIANFYHIPTIVSLAVVLGLLAGSILLSVIFPKKEAK